MSMLTSCMVGASMVVASLLSGGSSETITIGAGARVPIVVPADRILAEKTAAAELAAYVAKVTGEKLAVVSEEKAPAGPAIHLGATAFARKAVPDLDGVVCDNSELGQEYDVYVSVKIEGGDVFSTGKATPDTVYFLDQVVVVRKTLNSEGSKQAIPFP